MSIELVRGLAANEKLTLVPGNHPDRDQGLCAMEAVAWLAGLPHSDRPLCTSEVLAGYVRHLNDHMPDEERGRLVAFLPDLIDTADSELDHVLNNFLAWQAVHLFAPAALRAHWYGGYEAEADFLEDQHNLYDAREAAGAILKEWRIAGEGWPAQWALVRAEKAASLAPWFYDMREKPGKGVWGDTLPDTCARASAGAAFQAYRAGCAEAWDLALFVLEEALGIVKG